MKLDFMTKVLILAIAILTAILTFFVTKGIYNTSRATVQNQTIRIDTVWIRDTVRVPRIIIKGKLDTIYITEGNGSTRREQITAEADTSVFADGDTLNIATKYYFPPDNIFKHNIKWVKHTKEIHSAVTNTEQKEVPAVQDLFELGIRGEMLYPNFMVVPELYGAINIGKNSYWIAVSGEWDFDRIKARYKVGARFRIF